ncbi:MAG TPA: hypothetical protein VL087_04425 [Nitrospirota bacterium]|nr:hypothetical protein [Nitrospirota bacterium]
MKSRIIQAASVAIISFGLLASCAGTKLVAQWKDDAYQGHPAKIFVIGQSKEYGPRTLVEDEFVRQLKARGNDAIASYTVLPREEKPEKETVLKKVQEVGADVIIVVKFLKKEMGGTHTPLRRYAVPQGFDTSWDSYYGGVSTDVGVRDVSYDYDEITMETTLFQTATRKPIWSALSQTTYQSGGPMKQIKPFTTAIVKNLAQERLVR